MPSSPPGVPAAPTGIWVATMTDYTYRLTFGPGNAVTLDFLPIINIGNSQVGTFRAEGDLVYVDRIDRPMVLKFVNGAYQSTSYGPMMTFVKQ